MTETEKLEPCPVCGCKESTTEFLPVIPVCCVQCRSCKYRVFGDWVGDVAVGGELSETRRQEAFLSAMTRWNSAQFLHSNAALIAQLEELLLGTLTGEPGEKFGQFCSRVADRERFWANEMARITEDCHKLLRLARERSLYLESEAPTVKPDKN